MYKLLDFDIHTSSTLLKHIKQPSCSPIKSETESHEWEEYHMKIDSFFSTFKVWETFKQTTSIISSDNIEIAFFLKNSLPSHLRDIFQHPSAYDHKSISYSDRRFEKNQVGGRHHGFHRFKKSWVLFSESSIQFLRSCEPLIMYLNNLYRTLKLKDFKLAQKNVPKGWGLYKTVFTSLAANKDSTKWHKDTKDTNWTIIIYGGNFTKGELIIGTIPPCKIQVQPFDIVFLKAYSFFHTALPFIGERFSFSFYSEEISENYLRTLTRTENHKEFY